MSSAPSSLQYQAWLDTQATLTDEQAEAESRRDRLNLWLGTAWLSLRVLVQSLWVRVLILVLAVLRRLERGED